ncbi:MAG: hypothetical protein GX483_01445 [Actinomycetaceae bacterium]|nr:hypothetical protein [Actinomycetaceae bacterium]
MITNKEADEALTAMISDAVEDITRLTGGVAMCTYTKAGNPVPGIKYAEGRWAALKVVRRSAERGVNYYDAVVAAQAAWQTKLARLEENGAGKDWMAYQHGGVDALAEFLAVLEGQALDGAAGNTTSFLVADQG